MDIKITGLALSCCISILIGCSPRNCSDCRISFIIDSLIRSQSFSEGYKESQISNKKKLLGKVCEKIKDKGKIIFFEYGSKIDFIRRGSVFCYGSNDIYTYELDSTSIKIAKGYKYDREQIFKSSFSYFKDSTLEKLILQSNRNLADAVTFIVFYLDFDKNDFRLFIID